MKSKLKIFLLLSVAFYFGIELLNPFKEEVVDLKKFTDYYEETNEENGGVSVLADSFYTFEKEYNFPNEYKSLEEIKGTENGKAETTEVVEEGIVQLLDMPLDKFLEWIHIYLKLIENL